MNKKVILLVVLVLSLVMIFAGCSKLQESITNGDFTSYNEKDKAFDGWKKVADSEFKDGDKENLFSRASNDDSDQDKGHGNYLVVTQTKDGASYLSQEVRLKKGQTYKLSADVRVTSKISSSETSFLGAWVGFVEDGKVAIDVTTQSDNWQHNEIYFTPDTDDTLHLAVGIGHPTAGKSKGTANFDNIKIEVYNGNTDGVVVGHITVDKKGATFETPGSIAFVVVGAILGVMLMCLFMYLYRKTMSRTMLSEDNKMLSSMAVFIYMMIVAFIIRFLLAIFVDGMSADIEYFQNIASKFNNGTKIADVMGISGSTLPAGMMYLLFIVNGIANLLGIKGGFPILMRLPFILADLVAIYMIFNMVSKRQKEHTAVFVAGLYALLPSVLMVSTGWGMEVSIVGAFLIGMASCMLNKNYIGVTVLFTISLLFSNLTILLLPLVLVFLIYAFVKYDDKRLKIGISSLCALIAFYVLCVPFVSNQMGQGKPFYMFTLMFKNLTEINVLTLNAFGLYGMIGKNLVAIPKALNILNYIFVIALMIATVLIYLKNRDRLNIILMSAFTFIAVSTLSVRGNMETMALGIVLLFVYAMIANSRRAYALVGGFSILSFLNMSLLMSNSGYLFNDMLNKHLVNFNRLDVTFIVFSVIAVLMTLYLAYVVVDVCIRDRQYDIAPLDGKLKDDIKTRLSLFKERLAERKTTNNIEE